MWRDVSLSDSCASNRSFSSQPWFGHVLSSAVRGDRAFWGDDGPNEGPLKHPRSDVAKMFAGFQGEGLTGPHVAERDWPPWGVIT